MEPERSLLSWVRSIQLNITITSKRLKSLADLSDGFALFEFMTHMCMICRSPQHFDLNRLKSPATNWVVKLGNLRQFMACMDTYYTQALQLPLEVVADGIDLAEVAKKSDRASTFKLINLVLGAVIKGDKAGVHLGKITTSLGQEAQTVLMFAIKEFMSKCEGYDAPVDEAKVLKRENNKLKVDVRKLLYELEEVQQEVVSLVKKIEEVTSERNSEKEKAEEAEIALGKLRAEGIDAIDNSTFAQTLEAHLQQKESIITDLNLQLLDLKKLHAKEVNMLKDENDYQSEQLLHLRDLENSLEKYREKAEKLQASKKMNAELQRINEGLQNKLARYEEDISSLSAWKQSIVLMKEQLSTEKERSAKFALSIEEKEKSLREALKLKRELEEKMQFSESKMRELKQENERMRYYADTEKEDGDPNVISKAFSEAYETKITELQTENARIRALAGTEGMLKHLNEQLDSLYLAKTALEDRLKTAQLDKQTLSSELHEVKSQLHLSTLENTARIADLEQDLEASNQQIQAGLSRLQEHEREKVRFESISRDNEALKSENTLHMRDLKALYAEKDAANQRYIDCKEELILSKAALSELQSQLHRTEIDLKQTSTLLAQSKATESELSKELEAFKSRAGGKSHDVSERLKFLEAEKAVIRLTGELSEMKVFVKEKDEKIRSVASEYETLREELKTRLKRQELELQSVHQAEIQDLQQQRKEAQDELEFQKRLKEELTRAHNKEQKLMVMALHEVGLLVHRMKYSQDRLFRSQYLTN